MEPRRAPVPRPPRRPRASAAASIAAAALAALSPGSARGTDIIGVQPAALDQPRVNAVIRYPTSADPLYADLGDGSRSFNVQAYFDTGASGVLLSNNTAACSATPSTS